MDEFRQSKDRWNALVHAMNIPSIFCTWEWIFTWWEHYGKSYTPLILFIYDGIELKGIFPLALHNTTFNHKNPIKSRILSYCGSIELHPDHLDIISKNGDSKQCINAVADFLASVYNKWDILHIFPLSEGNRLLSYLYHQNFHMDLEIKQSSVSPYIAFPPNFEEYTKTFGDNLKYNLERRQRQLYKEQGVEYTTSGASEGDKDLRSVFHLHELRAKTKNIVSTFTGEPLFNFHNALIHRIRETDWLWLRFLKSGEEVIAAFYGFSLGRHLFYYQLGLNPVWGHYSPGMVLLYAVIKEAFSKGYKEFDFLHGNEKYKRAWTQNYRIAFSITLYNKTFRGSFSKALSQSKNLIKRNAKFLPAEKF
jgi:hypothetical protein